MSGTDVRSAGTRLARRFVCGEPDEGDLPVVMVSTNGYAPMRSFIPAQEYRHWDECTVVSR
eukprot:6849-Rhodomonas_salina.12